MEDYGQIRHMFLIEHLSQRTIAKKLGISRNTVHKYCDGSTYPGIRADYHRNSSIITPEVIQFIRQCLFEDAHESNKKQHHTAKRIYDRLTDELKFTGCESSIRAAVHKLRGNLNEAYVPLAFDPGDAMQIDWGECYVYLDNQRTKVNIFCARLCYSCAPFVICYRKQNTEAFLEGIIHAFEFFGGVPRRLIFDNAKVAVKSGYGKKAIRQEKYAALASHYCFETIFCNPASGNEKGLVENLVGWTRRNIFVPIPRAQTLEELNIAVKQGCCHYIDSHKIHSKPLAVKNMLQLDKEKLLMLPCRNYDASSTTQCRVSAYGTVRFATNNYSVPVINIGQIVAVKAMAETVDIYADGNKIAEHQRSYGHNQDILQMGHYLPILKRKPRSILQAKPVKNTLSSIMLQWLNDNKFTSKELIDILTACVEKGEDAVWQQRSQYINNKHVIKHIHDTVIVQHVSLAPYDQLLYNKGDGSLCQTQA